MLKDIYSYLNKLLKYWNTIKNDDKIIEMIKNKDFSKANNEEQKRILKFMDNLFINTK